jgi:hypothetical protein
MIAQEAMAFNSLRSALADPDRIPQILVTLISFWLIEAVLHRGSSISLI